VCDIRWRNAVQHPADIHEGTALQRLGQLLEGFLGCHFNLAHGGLPQKNPYEVEQESRLIIR
jgi:hypothetical protein